MDKIMQDVTWGTAGWFAFAAGTIGLAAGQTLRLSITNLSPGNAIVCCGLWQNPQPVSILEDSHNLGPGVSVNCDLKASDLPKKAFDETARAQIRAFVRSNCSTVSGTLEVFDNETSRTSVVLPLQEILTKPR